MAKLVAAEAKHKKHVAALEKKLVEAKAKVRLMSLES